MIISDKTLDRLKNLALKHNAVVGNILDWALKLAENEEKFGEPNPLNH